MTRILIPILLPCIVLTGGIVHGVWSDRWEPRSEEQVAEAGRLLKDFPLAIGAWEGHASPMPGIETRETVETIVTRQYVNRLSGARVGLLLACGHPKNIAMFHTPLECYPANGFAMVGNSIKHSIQSEDRTTTAEFLVNDFRLSRVQAPNFTRVFWSWTGDGDWSVPDYPRAVFGRYRVLYKLYVTSSPLDSKAPIDEDPCVDFLRDLLPVIDQTLLHSH
jgi:hypothetical protein